MENYGNDMYLSQEGYPSIDFTLLDRPSSSIVPAREPVAQFPQGESSFPSFDLFDGAGVESFNDQSFAGHGSYMLDTHNDAMRRQTSGKLSAISSQRQGVHDFFDQENQPQKAGSGTWPINEQSPYFLPGATSADGSLQRTSYLSNNYEPTSHNYNSERSSLAARMIRPTVGFTRPIVGEADHMKLLNVSSAMQNDARNQAMSSQRFLNPPQSNQFKPSYNMPFNNGISHNSTMDSLGYFGAQYQNQVDKYDVPNQAGVVFNNAPSYDFLGNQGPRRGPLQPSSQAAGGQLFQGLTRATGFSELQSQQQLQEMLIAHQLKQMEDARQQQMLQQAQNQFSRTSYSDLLHGPDTPPSQNQTGEIAIEAYETQAEVLPPQNAQVSGWSAAHGPPSYQGFVDLDMEQNQSSISQISLFGEALDSGRHPGDQNGPALSSFSEGQNAMPQYLGGGRISPSRPHTGKAMLEPSCTGSEHFGQIQTTNFGLENDWNEFRRTSQPHAKLSGMHNPQHPADSLMGHKIMGSSLSQVDVFSQSQQHFQELQFNEQRSCSFEQKQPVPSQSLGFLPQSNLNCAKSTWKNGMQQCLNGVNSTTNAAGYSSYQLESTPFDVGASSEQPQWSTTSSLGVQSRHTNVEMGSQQQSNLWDSMPPAQPHQGADFNQRPMSDAQYSSLSNSSSQQVLQQRSPMLGVPPSSGKASAVRQQEFYNAQNSSMKLRASSPGNGVNSSQKSSTAVQDCRKEINETILSDRLPFSEPASHIQGAWKKYTPPSQFPSGVSTLSQPLDGLNPSYGFQGQGYVNSQATLHPVTVSKNPNNASLQYDLRQQACEERLSVEDDRRLERCISQDLTGGLPTANFMKTLSRQAVKVVPDVAEEVQGLLCKSAEPQDTFFEKQREVPEQQVDSCTASISLAHLKGNQSSNSLSPQHFKLGLGPSNSSQDFQQVNETKWRSFPQIQGLDGEVPNLKAAHMTFHTGSPHGTSASEMKRKNDFEGSSATINRTILQSNATHPLAFSHRSSPVSKETALFDASPPPRFASGHEMGSDAVFSANATSYNPGHQASQSEYGMGGDSSSGVSRVQTSTLNHTGCRDSLMNGYIGKSSSISNSSRQPNYNAGSMLVHNQILNDNMRQSNYDGGGMHLVQNHHSSNMALKQLENRAQAVNLAGSATAVKTSLIEQSKAMGSHEQEFCGIVESSRLPSNSVQGVGGRVQRDSSRLMQRTEMMLSNPMKQGDKRHSVQTSVVGRHAPEECNSQLDANKAKAFGIEASGLLSNTLHPNLQGGKSFSVSPLNRGVSNSSEAGGLNQDQNKYQHAKPLNDFTFETDAVVKSFSRPPLQTSPSFDQGYSVQHMSHEGIQQIHTFEGIGPNVRAGRLSEPAVLSVSERKKYSLNLGRDSTDSELVGEWTVSQPTADSQLTTGEQIARFKALQKHNAFISEETVEKNAESLEVGYSQSPKRSDNSCVVASFKGREKDSSVPLASSEVLHQTVPYASNLNQQSLFSVGSKQDKLTVPGNTLNLLQQSSGNKEAKLASNDDQENKLPLGLQSSDFKEDGVRTPAQVSISTSTYEHQLSPAKTIINSVGALPSKKRKKQLPLLIPWHIAAAQSKIDLPTSSYAEELWANASNRLPEKDAMTTHDESTLSISRAKRRLLLTSGSMQRLLPPLPDGLMHENTPANKECAIYSLAKLALEDACGLVAKRIGQAALAHTSPARINVSSQGQASAENNALTKCVESFMERVMQLGMELARLDCSTSASELQGETHELEKLSIVNRLARHHGIGFTMDSSDNLFIENIFGFGSSARKPLPQKYVTAAPMPRTLPEGVRCLSL